MWEEEVLYIILSYILFFVVVVCWRGSYILYLVTFDWIQGHKDNEN